MNNADWALAWDIILQHPSLIWTTIIPALAFVGVGGWVLQRLFTGRSLAGVRADLAGLRADLSGVRGELGGVRAENAVLKERMNLHGDHRSWAEAKAKDFSEQLKVVTEQLSAAQATNESLKNQFADAAAKEAIADTSAKINSANNNVKELENELEGFREGLAGLGDVADYSRRMRDYVATRREKKPRK
jgi:chromosome segregation ATPase